MNATEDGFISEFGTNPMIGDFEEEQKTHISTIMEGDGEDEFSITNTPTCR